MASQQPEPDSTHLHLLNGVDFRPIFIMGDHRSGTTLLYQMLAATNHFNVVTAYNVIEYGSLLDAHLEGRTAEAKRNLHQRFVSAGLTNRVIDGVEVSPDLTEEYGFVIDQGQKPRIHPRSLARFRELCGKLSFIAGNGKPLLLKNPWDILGFRYVRECFPEAKFVFIHRHPEDVINSQLRAIRSMLESRNEYVAMISPWYRQTIDNPVQLACTRALFSPELPFWKHLVPRHIVKVGDYFIRNIGSVPESSRIVIRYEDLCANPASTMSAVLGFLRFPDAGGADFSQWIEPRTPKLLPGVREAFEAVRPSLRPFLAAAGYERAASAAKAS